MKRSALFLILLLFTTSVFADDVRDVTEKLSKTLGPDSSSFFTEVYTVANSSVKSELIAMGKRIIKVDDETIQRVSKILKDYTIIDQATAEYNQKYNAKLENASMENILLKRAIEDLKASKTSDVVIVKGLSSYNKKQADALLSFMQLVALEDVNGIENREKLFFDTVREKLGLPPFDQEFCHRVSGDKCGITNSTAHPI